MFKQKKLVDVLSAIILELDGICICYWCQNTYQETDIERHLMVCPLNIFKSNTVLNFNVFFFIKLFLAIFNVILSIQEYCQII